MRRRLTIAILATGGGHPGGHHLRQRCIHPARRHRHRPTGARRSGPGHSATFSDTHYRTKAAFQRDKKLISEAAGLAGIDVVGLEPTDHHRARCRPGSPAADLDVPRLQQGRQTTGHTSSLLAYSAVPTPMTAVNAYVPVLVVTRQIHDPANGIRYFLLVGAIGLVVAAVVATALARRFSRPLVAAVAATRRIASGDLDATVPVGRGEDPGVRPAGRVDQHHGRQPGAGPGAGTSVPPVASPMSCGRR